MSHRFHHLLAAAVLLMLLMVAAVEVAVVYVCEGGVILHEPSVVFSTFACAKML